MNQNALIKLEWHLLLSKLSAFGQTTEACQRLSDLTPNLDRDEIVRRWRDVGQLAVLARRGYHPPIGELDPVDAILRAAEVGRTLTGEQIQAVARVARAARLVLRFAQDFAETHAALAHLIEGLAPEKDLIREVDAALTEEGELRDDASPELQQIRRRKADMRHRIEGRLKKFLRDHDVSKYIQDDFFTVRAQRYVIPISLDGHGRVPGSVLDTSSSGQTLFIEPQVVSTLNHELCELELAEKLEIARIFNRLSGLIAGCSDGVARDYQQLIELDMISAQARLAVELDAGQVELVDEPQIHLLRARHPLINPPREGTGVVPNDILVEGQQRALIISGPNAGGKTVVLKTVGMLHAMAKAGLLVPADPRSRLFLYREVYIEMGDAQSLSANLSTFSGHVKGLVPIATEAGSKDLVLLDELAVGTEPQTGAALAQSVLERLVDRQVTIIATTHYDSLKTLAITDDRFRNGSMAYSTESLRPTYRLVLDVPGQSHGLEVARENGLDPEIIERATELRGQAVSRLEEAISKLESSRRQADTETAKAVSLKEAAEAEKERWRQEVKLLEESRHQRLVDLKDRYELQFEQLRSELEDQLTALKKKARQRGEGRSAPEDVAADKARFKETFEQARGQFGKLQVEADATRPQRELGPSVTVDDLKVGERVFVTPLKKEGEVSRLPDGPGGKVQVQVGALSLSVAPDDLRGRRGSAGRRSVRSNRSRGKVSAANASRGTAVISTSTNTVDVRGMTADDALARLWKFIDGAMLRGEFGVVVVHGHGTGSLKKAIRHAVVNDSPYALSWSPGDRNQGGDGVTNIVFS